MGRHLPSFTRTDRSFPTRRSSDLGDHRSAPQSVDLFGYNFWYRAPCQVVYRAGYETSQTTVLVSAGDPATVTFTPTATGQWIKDEGVTLNGVEATKIGRASCRERVCQSV